METYHTFVFLIFIGCICGVLAEHSERNVNVHEINLHDDAITGDGVDKDYIPEMDSSYVIHGSKPINMAIDTLARIDHPQGTCAPDDRNSEGHCESRSRETLRLFAKPVDVIITFKNAKLNFGLQQKFKLTTWSLLKTSSVPINFYIIGDPDSQIIAEELIEEGVRDHGVTTRYEMAKVDVDSLSLQLSGVVKPMQRHFSSPGSYFSDPLFFLSIALHRVMPTDLKRVIMLDADLKFKADIHQLFRLFDEFGDSNVIGIARENQPVYRHTFSLYRSLNPKTRVGEPPPNGITGFNSGVLLLDLERMRKSLLYNSLLDEDTLFTQTTKYHFKGHLGDQDFFTLLSIEYEELFYILPCGWNRQLCTWWRDKGGYEPKIFDLYYTCDEPTCIYHGNCNTEIPND